MKHHSKMCDMICKCVMPLYVPGRDKENVATMEGEKWINQSFCLLIIQKHFGTYLGWSIIIPMSLTYTPGGRFCSHALEVLIKFQRIMNRRGTFCYNLVIWSNLCIYAYTVMISFNDTTVIREWYFRKVINNNIEVKYCDVDINLKEKVCNNTQTYFPSTCSDQHFSGSFNVVNQTWMIAYFILA